MPSHPLPKRFLTTGWLAVTVGFGVLLGGVAPAEAEITQASLQGGVLEAQIALPGGGQVELTIDLEDASGITVQRLGLSVEEVDPSDPAIQARLPAAVSLPAALPFILRIEPDPGVALRGVARLSFYTHDLEYAADSPLRVFAAPIGGAFEDVTESGAPGSYRGGGVTPRFNTDFTLVEDERARELVADLKLDALVASLAENLSSIEALTGIDLTNHLDAVVDAVGRGDYIAAVQELEAFIDVVEAASGGAIPDVWMTVGNANNVAGQLRAEAWTLRYTLLQLANGLQ